MPGPMQRAAFAKFDAGYETPEERAFRLSQQPWADIQPNETEDVRPEGDAELIRKAKLALARRKLAAIREKERVEEPTFPTTTMTAFPEMEQPEKGLLEKIFLKKQTPYQKKQAEAAKNIAVRAAMPVAEAIGTGMEAVGRPIEAISKGTAATLASGFTKGAPERRALQDIRVRRPGVPGPTLEEVQQSYEATDMPWGVKGALETVPWLAIPGAMPVQAGLKTAAVSTTLPKAIRFMARGGAAALEPLAVTEEVIGKGIGAIAKPIVKPIARAIERRRLAPIEEATRQTAIEKMTTQQVRKETAAESRAAQTKAFQQEAAIQPEYRQAIEEQESYGRGALRPVTAPTIEPPPVTEIPKTAPAPVKPPPVPPGKTGVGAPSVAEVPKPVTPSQLPFGKVPKGKGAGIKGLGAAPYGADPLQRTMNMWQPVAPNKIPLLGRIGKVEKAIEEFATDKFALINQMTTRAKKSLGGQIPIEKDAELWLANLSGAPEAGMVKFNEGFAEVNRTLGKEINLDYVRSYLHLKHAIDIEAALGPQRMIPGGIQGAREAQQGLDIMRQQLGQANFARVEAAAEVTRNYYRNMLENLVNEGLVARETADEWINKFPWYNQTKIEFELDEAMGGLGRKASVTSSGIKHLTEEGTQQFREDPFATMMRASLQNEVRISQNRAARAIIQSGLIDPKAAADIIKVTGVRPVAQVAGETVFRRVPGEIPGTLSYMENGVRQIYEVPAWIEKEAKHLSMLPAASWERIGSAINRASRAGMTGVNLAFFIPNFGIDSLTALITEQVGPLRLGSSLARNLIAIVKEDAGLNRMLKAGAGQSGFWGKAPAEIVSAVEKSGNIVLNQANWKHLLQNPLKTISEIGHAVEMGPRRAVFEKRLAQGAAEPYAALGARRATIDFQRSGYGIKQANALYLYLNAGIQGTTIPFRALRDSAKARWAVAGFTGAIAATYAWNRQFPEYDDIPDYIKYGSVVTMVPSDEYDNRGNKVPHYFTVIPNLREWALFSAPIIYTLRKLDERAPEDVSQFLGSIFPQLNPLSQFTGQSGLPVPTQLGETLTEIAINKDTFRNRPIVPNELKGLPPAQQYNQYTSLAAKRMGQVINLSPMKIDFFVKGVFGGLGQQVLTAMDLGAKHIYPDYEDPKIISLLGQLKEIKPPNYKPEDVARERNKFLFGLSSVEREKVLELERKPVTRLPVISTIANRLYREYGGQLYETGQKIASKVTGVSEEQSEAVSKILSKANAELQAGQEKADKQLELTGDWRTWIQNHKDSSKFYQGMIMALAAEYPASAQALKDPEAVKRYYDSIYTLGLSMPDRRSRAQLLTAGWRAIQPEEKPDGEMDWDKFFTERQKYKNALIPQDRALLDEEIKATMTKYEKIYYAEQEKLAPYWSIERDVWSKYSPELKRISDQMDILEKQDKNKFNAMAYRYPQVIFVKNRIAELQKQYKYSHPEISAILKRWY